MQLRNFTQLFATLLALLVCSTSFAQDNGKAKVKIKKSEDGSTEEFYEEFDLQEGQDIEDILRQLDLLDEFGQLRDGQAFEISIKKLDGEDELQNYDISFYPEGHEFRGFLGVMLKESNEFSEGEVQGAVVSEVIEGTAAEDAGLQIDDRIVQVNDEEIESVGELVEYISAHEAGTNVTVRYIRDGKKKKSNVTLGERPQEDHVYYFNGFDELEEMENLNYMVFPEMLEGEQWTNEPMEMEIKPFLGVSPACGPSEGQGVELGSITSGSSAQEMGLLKGDRITEFNGKAVSNFDELTEAIFETEPGDEVKIDIIREGKSKKIKGDIGQRAYSKCDEMNIYHEYKGCDEGGNMLYNYEFNFDEESMQESMEQMMEELNQREAERREMMDEWAAREVESRDRMDIRIEVENISDDEINSLSATAEPQLKNSNDLEVEGISFFPNPNNGIVNLNFSLNDRSSVDILIYDHNGSIIYKESLLNFNGNYDNTIDISDEADGVYYLQIMQGEQTYSKKLIKNS